MKNKVHQGVILAAGRGNRIHPLTNLYPKPLQPVCNKPIMQYQMEIMREAGIEEVAIVIGPNGNPIREFFRDGNRVGIKIEYIEDPEPAGIASSLACAEPWVRGPFVVFLGDIFLVVSDFAQALTPVENGAKGTVVVRRDTPDAIRQNFAVVFDKNKRVEYVIEKPTHAMSDFKGCGVYVFTPDIFDAIRRTPRSTLRNEYEITDALQLFIEFGGPIFAADVVRWDVNVTYPKDLLTCNLLMLREMRLENLIGKDVFMHKDARVTSSVIGDRAVIDTPVFLKECLILPDAHVSDPSGTLQRCILTDRFVLTGETLKSWG